MLFSCDGTFHSCGICMACIAMLVGVDMGLKMFRPYRAGNSLRCSCIVVRECFVILPVQHVLHCVTL